MAQQTNYNGNRYSFTDISIEGETSPNLGAVPFQFAKGIVQALHWDWQQDKGIVQGNQVGIVGRTKGYGTCTGSIELLTSEADDWVATVTGNGAVPLGDVFFNLRIAYSVNGTDVRVDSLVGCTLTKGGNPNQKGNDATMKSYEFSAAKVYQNGILMYGDPAT